MYSEESVIAMWSPRVCDPGVIVSIYRSSSVLQIGILNTTSLLFLRWLRELLCHPKRGSLSIIILFFWYCRWGNSCQLPLNVFTPSPIQVLKIQAESFKVAFYYNVGYYRPHRHIQTDEKRSLSCPIVGYTSICKHGMCRNLRSWPVLCRSFVFLQRVVACHFNEIWHFSLQRSAGLCSASKG